MGLINRKVKPRVQTPNITVPINKSIVSNSNLKGGSVEQLTKAPVKQLRNTEKLKRFIEINL